jgi:hypothetical protein
MDHIGIDVYKRDARSGILSSTRASRRDRGRRHLRARAGPHAGGPRTQRPPGNPGSVTFVVCQYGKIATWLLEAGADIRWVKDQMGHALDRRD